MVVFVVFSGLSDSIPETEEYMTITRQPDLKAEAQSISKDAGMSLSEADEAQKPLLNDRRSKMSNRSTFRCMRTATFKKSGCVSDMIAKRTLIGLIGLLSPDVSGTAMRALRRDHDREDGPESVVTSVHISPISPISVLFPISSVSRKASLTFNLCLRSASEWMSSGVNNGCSQS